MKVLLDEYVENMEAYGLKVEDSYMVSDSVIVSFKKKCEIAKKFCEDETLAKSELYNLMPDRLQKMVDKDSISFGATTFHSVDGNESVVLGYGMMFRVLGGEA